MTSETHTLIAAQIGAIGALRTALANEIHPARIDTADEALRFIATWHDAMKSMLPAKPQAPSSASLAAHYSCQGCDFTTQSAEAADQHDQHSRHVVIRSH